MKLRAVNTEENKSVSLIKKTFEIIILVAILINIITLGIETSSVLSEKSLSILKVIDRTCLCIFIIELVIRIGYSIYHKENFFKSRWNLFDFIIIFLSIIPEIGFLSIFRTFKILRSIRTIRVLKSFKAFKSMKIISSINELSRIFRAMVLSIPGITWTFILLILFFYIYGIIGVNLFGTYLPDMFGTLPKAFFTLFQVMTFESWSMGIARPLMEINSFSWIYFISFVLITTYMILNVVIGIVSDSIQIANREIKAASIKKSDLEEELDILKTQIEKIEIMLQEKNKALQNNNAKS